MSTVAKTLVLGERVPVLQVLLTPESVNIFGFDAVDTDDAPVALTGYTVIIEVTKPDQTLLQWAGVVEASPNNRVIFTLTQADTTLDWAKAPAVLHVNNGSGRRVWARGSVVLA